MEASQKIAASGRANSTSNSTLKKDKDDLKWTDDESKLLLNITYEYKLIAKQISSKNHYLCALGDRSMKFGM